jgi:hypothetical protein
MAANTGRASVMARASRCQAFALGLGEYRRLQALPRPDLGKRQNESVNEKRQAA